MFEASAVGGSIMCSPERLLEMAAADRGRRCIRGHRSRTHQAGHSFSLATINHDATLPGLFRDNTASCVLKVKEKLVNSHNDSIVLYEKLKT